MSRSGSRVIVLALGVVPFFVAGSAMAKRCKPPLVRSPITKACIKNPCPAEAPFDPETGTCQCGEVTPRWNAEKSVCEACPQGQAWTGGECALRVYTFEAANYWFNEIKVIREMRDSQECARLCEQNPVCKVATFGDENAGRWAHTCTLRSAASNRHTDQVGLRSWVKY